jgi:outer membrane immunogenic protein
MQENQQMAHGALLHRQKLGVSTMKTTDRLRRLGAGALVLAAMGFATAAMADGAPRGAAKDCCGYDWRGFYFGGHIGLSNVDVDRSIVNSPFWAGTTGTGGLEDVANGRLTLGGHLGYNFTSGPWVFGIEATLSDVSPRQNVQSPLLVTDRWRIDVDALTTVTGRLGYAMNKAMVYVKAGYAGADVDSRVSNQFANVVGVCGPTVTGQLCQSGDSQRHNGWTVGTGIELSVHKNVIAGFEYNYIDLGSESTTTPSAATSPIFLNQSVDVQIHSFMGRVSYKLN